MDRSARLALQRCDAPVDGPLVAIADHQIHPFDGGDAFRRKLGVTARDGHQRAGILPDEAPHEVAALLVGMLGDRTSVHHAYIGLLARLRAPKPALLELAGDGGGFGKIQLASQRTEFHFSLGRHGLLFFRIRGQMYETDG